MSLLALHGQHGLDRIGPKQEAQLTVVFVTETSFRDPA